MTSSLTFTGRRDRPPFIVRENVTVADHALTIPYVFGFATPTGLPHE
jgi:hypothetical protein